MTEKNLELLNPGDYNLTDPKRCAYREGREHHRFNIKPNKFLEMPAKSHSAAINRSIMHSFETIWHFTLGIHGEPLEKDDCKDYCKERCIIASCEYK